MKKKTISAIIVLFSLIIVVSAAPRWSYFSDVIYGAKFQNGGIDYSAVTSTYDLADVTHTEVIIKFQVATGAGWGTIKTLSSKEPGHVAGAGEIYKDYLPGRSYRISITCKAYNGSTVLEEIGPIYDYANTPA